MPTTAKSRSRKDRPMRFFSSSLLLSSVLALGACGNTPSGGDAGSVGADMAVADQAPAADLAMNAKPNAPSALKAVPLHGGAHVTWKDNSSDEDEFLLMRKEGAGPFAEVTRPTFDTTAFHDVDVTSGKTYTYVIYAVKGQAQSDASNEAMITLP